MTNDYELFMLQNTLKSNEEIKNTIQTGETVKVYYNKLIGNSVHPITATGKIVGIAPFEYIETTGGKIHFLSREHIIKLIVTESGKNIYDKTFEVGDNTRVGENLSVARRRVLGTDQAPTQKRQNSISLGQGK